VGLGLAAEKQVILTCLPRDNQQEMPKEGMMKRVEVDIEELRRFMRYDPETGKLYWKVDGLGTITKDREAFTARNGRYYRGGFRGVRVYAHVAAWMIYYGVKPRGEIDHINRDGTDNRLCNLRDVTKSGNQHNSSNRLDNKTGICGVKQRKDSGRFEAQIQVGGKRMYLGRYETLTEAVAARKRAEQRLLS